MLESVLNLARTRLNDAIQAIGGDILTDTQPFTATMTNSAWRKMQAYLANLGYSKYKRKFFAIGMPVTATTDPSQPNIWNWTYFFDGSSYWSPSSNPPVPVPPSDFICPLYMKERQTGSNSRFVPMRMAPDGLIENYKKPWNGQFEWKNDSIYIPGSTVSMDFEVEYAAYDADFVSKANILGDPGTNPPTTPANMPVPIMRCQSCFANYLAAECAAGRDDMDAPGLLVDAEKDAKLLMNNDVKLKQRTPVQRRPYSGRGNRSTYWGSQGY
jgi:hypothetical protein